MLGYRICRTPCVMQRFRYDRVRWGWVGAGEVKLRDKALQALGQLFVSRPALMLLDGSLEVTASALAPAAPLLLKHRMLSNLTELLKARRPRFISFDFVHPAYCGFLNMFLAWTCTVDMHRNIPRH